MEHYELIRALKRISVPDAHCCFGCGYERNCQLHGCVIIRAAIAELERAETARKDAMNELLNSLRMRW